MKEICPLTTALVAVDPQRGFTPLCPNELPVPDGDQIVGEIKAMAALCTLRVVTKDWHPAAAPWMAARAADVLTPVTGYPHLDVKWPPHCIAGSEGAMLIPGLTEDEFDLLVLKGMEPDRHPYGACYHGLDASESTGLIEFLRHRRVHTVLVGGLATEYCVATTARQLAAAGFAVIVNLAACRGLSAAAIAAAVAQMQAEGIMIVENCRDLEGRSLHCDC